MIVLNVILRNDRYLYIVIVKNCLLLLMMLGKWRTCREIIYQVKIIMNKLACGSYSLGTMLWLFPGTFDFEKLQRGVLRDKESRQKKP